MSWLLRKLKTLTRRENPSQGDILHLFSQETGKDHWVALADLQGGGGYPDWSSVDAAAGEYDTGSKVTYAFKLWESLVDNNATTPSENGSWTEVSTATTTFEKIYERVELAAHGFAIGECLKKGATIDSWDLIDGTADDQEELRGIVISVPDADNFVVALPASRVRGFSGLTPGAIHYADASGVLTTTPTDVKVLFADTATTGYMLVGGSSGVQYFLGVFASLVALQTAYPTSDDGYYAYVNSVGNDVVQYIWDEDDGAWVLAGSASLGDVVGPASATNNAIALFDTASGKLLKDSAVVLTTVGAAFAGLANPSAITFPRINADNSVTARSAANFLADIGGQATGLSWLLGSGGTLTAANTMAMAGFNVNFLNGNILIGPTGATITANTRFEVIGTGTTSTNYTYIYRNSAGTALQYQAGNGNLNIISTAVAINPFSGNTQTWTFTAVTSTTLSFTSLAALTASSGYTFTVTGANPNNVWTFAKSGTLSSSKDVFSISTGTLYQLTGSSAATRVMNLVYLQSTGTLSDATSTVEVNHFSAGGTFTESTNTSTHRGFYYTVNPGNLATNNYAFVNTTGFTAWRSVLSPAQITANQNDYSPTGLVSGGAPYGASIMRINTDASRNITSMGGGKNGRLMIIHNVGAFDAVIKNDDGATGTAANRFALNADITLQAGEGLLFWYDGTSSRWRALTNA
jgi:hypothetical protein